MYVISYLLLKSKHINNSFNSQLLKQTEDLFVVLKTS